MIGLFAVGIIIMVAIAIFEAFLWAQKIDDAFVILGIILIAGYVGISLTYFIYLAGGFNI